MEEEIRQLKVDLEERFGVGVKDVRDLMTQEGLLKLARQASGDSCNRFFHAAAEKDQGNLHVWYEWGCKLSKSETTADWKEAISKFKCALECQEGHPETLHEWGLILKKFGKIFLQSAREKLWEARENAFEANNRALTSIILTDFAKVLSDQDEETAAALCLKEAILYDPKNVKAFWKLGEVLAEEEEYEESLKKFKRADELDPRGCPDGLTIWGRTLLLRSEQLEDDSQEKVEKQNLAEEKCKRACELDEQNGTPLHVWGEVLAARKRFKEAAEKFQKANEKKADHWTVCCWAMALSELNRDEEARKMLQGKLNEIEAQRKVLETEMADEDALESKVEWRADVLKSLGLVLKKQGKKDAARQRFKDAAKCYQEANQPKKADECSTLADSCGSTGASSPASSSHEETRTRAPPKRRVHHVKSWCRLGLDKKLWDAFQDCPQPLDLISVQKLHKLALEDNNKVDPTERRVFEYILSPETSVQVTQEASDFLAQKVLKVKAKTPRTGDRSRSRRGRA